jgi:mono/diheme cytochrome c family protein
MTRFLPLPAFFSIALLQIGCGSQPYPTALAYPLRSDLIVDRLPDNSPDGPPAAGKLDEFIAAINERGGKTYDPANLSAEQKATLQRSLEEIFGSPSEPAVRGHDDETTQLADRLQFQPEKLAAGSVLYRKHCLQCHGLSGDGRGPTGQWVYPFPRDFRQGVFKYVSSSGSAARKPTRADLQRLVAAGIERTSMPAFALLAEDDRDRLISYTIHLGVRGEVEYRMMRRLLSHQDDSDDDLVAEMRGTLTTVLRQWAEADVATIAPAAVPTPDDPNLRVTAAHLDSVRRGFSLFTNQAIGCSSCHVDYGRQSRYLYDCWGGSVRATDLTEGAFHGGKRPIDLFQRIRGGVGPSGMPAAVLSEDQVWDLVHFLLTLPVPKMLPSDVREHVYPGR